MCTFSVMTTPSITGQPLRVLGYVRVSTDKQDIGPEVQIATLEAEATRNGWSLEIRREDAASAKSLEGRPVLAEVLADLKARRADALAVSKLDRLSRDVADFAGIMKLGARQGWAVVALDLNVDTTTPTGAAMAQVTMTFAELERRRIGERTRDGMAKIKEQTGKHMGRRAKLPLETALYVHKLKLSGLSLRMIADRLTAELVPTATGGRWHASSVKAVLESVTLNNALAASRE